MSGHGRGPRARLVRTQGSRADGRLREALQVTRAAFDGAEDPEPANRDLVLFCHGFCVALTRHHEAEDRGLFPAIAARTPGCARRCGPCSRTTR